MANKDFDAIVYIRRAPTYSFDEGLFHVCYPIGPKAQAQFVMQPSVYLKALRAAEKAYRQFSDIETSVVPIRGRKAKPSH